MSRAGARVAVAAAVVACCCSACASGPRAPQPCPLKSVVTQDCTLRAETGQGGEQR